MSLRVVTHAALLGHDPGEEHPECPRRLVAVLHELASAADISVEEVDRVATLEELSAVHDPAYVTRVLGLSGGGALDHETFLSVGSVEAARRAAGIVIGAVEALAAAGTGTTFALVRPPGHHASASAGMGYCVFNNAAIGARRALEIGVERVAILDWDAHAGNGTQALLGHRSDVMIIDVHQDGLFPRGAGRVDERGTGDGLWHTVNAPLAAQSGDADYVHVLDTLAAPLLRRFAPGLIIVSAGFDAHWTDPHAQLGVTTDGFGVMAARIRALAAELGAPALLVLEGGYDAAALGRNVRRCVEVLAGMRDGGSIEGHPSEEVRSIVAEQLAAMVGRVAERTGAEPGGPHAR
jgi:acetoin utilization deacetylase AcuC-like enzyme